MRPGPAWLDRVLARDDGDPAERATIDAELAANPIARRLLERVRRIETGEEDPIGELPPLESALLALSAAEREEADRSLARLKERLAATAAPAARAAAARAPARTAGVGERWREWIRGPRWTRLAPAAGLALLAAIVILRPGANGPGREPAPEEEWRPGLGELSVSPAARIRGTGEEAVETPGAVRVWRTGEAFVLRCPIERSVIPVLFHIDPEGAVALLHPAEATGPFLVHPADRTLELPVPEQGIEWVLEGTSGTETFLLAAAAPGEGAGARLTDILPGVVRTAAGIAETAESRTDLISGVRELLEREIGEVRTTEITHEE